MLMIPRDRFGLSLFNNMFKDSFMKLSDSPAMMKTDIKEKDGSYALDMDLPGFSKEDIKADIENGYLTITAAKNENKEEKDDDGKFVYQERYTGQCTRSFYVGNNVNQEDIKAEYKDGTLHLEFPKKDEKQIETKKQIAIE